MEFNGLKLRLRRTALRWKQSDLAEKCGIATSTISAMEKHGHLPNSKILLRLASILDVSVDYFLKEELNEIQT